MKPPPPGPLDAVFGWMAWAGWWLVGLLALPGWWLSLRARRHIWRVPRPVPGWTWMHGASLGEHQAVAALRAQWPDRRVWPTSASPRTPVLGAFPAPADLPFVIGPWLDTARPARLVLVESELWPGWLVACRRRGIPVVVVQARPSKGWQRWARLGPIWRWLMADVTVVPQSETGDLKAEAPRRPVSHPLPPGAIVLVSARVGDAQRALDAWTLLPTPRPRLAIAPRHLDTCPQVAALAQARGLTFSRQSTADPHGPLHLIDTMGELADLLPGAAAVMVGGTWDRSIGGHSPAAAVRAGVPVVAGPHRTHNPAAWERATVLVSADSPAALAHALKEALQTPAVAQPQDAVAKAIARIPEGHTPPEHWTYPGLWPLVPLVHIVGRLRPGWHGRPVRVSVPVVSVGGLTAGGAGKTPMAGWLAERLPGAWVVARGHKRKAGPPVRIGRPGVPPEHDLGDELEMFRRRGLCVVSAPDRIAGARAAIAGGAQCIVLDDGFQHRRLHRDVDVVCIDTWAPGGGGLIPVGTRREPWSALQRADVVVAYGTAMSAPIQGRPTVCAQLELSSVSVRGSLRPLSDLPENIEIATSLARPSRLICALLERGHTVRSVRLAPDHQPLGPLPAGCVVTEKDAARRPPTDDVRVVHGRLVVADPGPLVTALAAAGLQLSPAPLSLEYP